MVSPNERIPKKIINDGPRSSRHSHQRSLCLGGRSPHLRLAPQSDFNYVEFATIKSQAGENVYRTAVKKTRAIALRATAGRHGGTFAHSDSAFEFGRWISKDFIRNPIASRTTKTNASSSGETSSARWQ